MAKVLQNIKRKKQVFAWEKVNEVKTKKTEYKSLVEKIGMMIYTNGLISTLAHLKGKQSKPNKPNEYNYLYNHLSEWLKQEDFIPFKLTNNKDLLEEVLSIDNAKVLLLLTKEILILSDAFKEMVKAKMD